MTSPPGLEGYLAEITACLPGPRRPRAAIVAELRSGLLDAAEAHESAGLPRAAAAAAAFREFGDPAWVASGFRAEIAAGQARRSALMLLATGPLTGLLWIGAVLASHLGTGAFWSRAGRSPGLQAGLELVAVAVAVTALAGLLGVASTGRLTRWLPDRPRRAPTATAVAGFGAVGADAIVLALLAAELTVGPGELSPVPAAVAAAASLARLMAARRAACRCLAIRASLT
jgi:hypothetical protein